MTARPPIPSRRRFLAGAGSVLAAPAIWSRRANAAGQLVMRTPGGEADDARRELIFKPFFKETGIEVLPVAANTSKILASIKAGAVEIDIVDNSTDALIRMARIGGLVPIDYKGFKYTDPADIDPKLKSEFYVAQYVYATLMGFDTGVFPAGQAPQSWAEFWDVKRFPGPRTLADLNADYGNLEFALLADGVPMDKLYPLDLGRAFASLSRIRPSVPKFWSSGAQSVQMLTDKEVNMGSIWSSRLWVAIDKGASLAGQWNQNQVEVQAFGILKSAPNLANAMKYVDFALQPDIQAAMIQLLPIIPANRKVEGKLRRALIDPATGTPWTSSQGFIFNVDWWVDNVDKVSAAWSKWIAS